MLLLSFLPFTSFLAVPSAGTSLWWSHAKDSVAGHVVSCTFAAMAGGAPGSLVGKWSVTVYYLLFLSHSHSFISPLFPFSFRFRAVADVAAVLFG